MNDKPKPGPCQHGHSSPVIVLQIQVKSCQCFETITFGQPLSPAQDLALKRFISLLKASDYRGDVPC